MASTQDILLLQPLWLKLRNKKMQDHAPRFQHDVQLFYVQKLVGRIMWTTVHHTVYVKLDAM